VSSAAIVPPPTGCAATGAYATPSRTVIAYTGKHTGNNKQTKNGKEEEEE